MITAGATTNAKAHAISGESSSQPIRPGWRCDPPLAAAEKLVASWRTYGPLFALKSVTSLSTFAASGPMSRNVESFGLPGG